MLSTTGMDVVTTALAGTIVLAAVGGGALCVLVARYGIGPATEPLPWTARRYFFARATYFTVGAAFALTGVLAAVGLAASERATSVAMARSPAGIRDRAALEARIHALESTLDEIQLRISRLPADLRWLGNGDLVPPSRGVERREPGR